MRVQHWLLQLLIAIDQLGNALLGGWADETLSSRAWRTEQKGRVLGQLLRPVIDGLFRLIGQKSHCYDAFQSERKQRQSPPEAREPKESP